MLLLVFLHCAVEMSISFHAILFKMLLIHSEFWILASGWKCWESES